MEKEDSVRSGSWNWIQVFATAGSSCLDRHERWRSALTACCGGPTNCSMVRADILHWLRYETQWPHENGRPSRRTCSRRAAGFSQGKELEVRWTRRLMPPTCTPRDRRSGRTAHTNIEGSGQTPRLRQTNMMQISLRTSVTLSAAQHPAHRGTGNDYPRGETVLETASGFDSVRAGHGLMR